MAPTKTLQEQMIDRGHELREEKAALLAQIAANRRSLRDLGVQGLLTEDELVLVNEMYPEHERKSLDERIEEADQKAASLREKAEAEAAEAEQTTDEQ